jgi:hypothetical protein
VSVETRLGNEWTRLQEGADGEMWISSGGLKVIWSAAVELDGRAWLHVSVSRPDRIPSYSDMTRVKSLFIGDDRYAYSVWPAREAHVNIHERCLHLWAVLEGDEPLPDFTQGTGTI